MGGFFRICLDEDWGDGFIWGYETYGDEQMELIEPLLPTQHRRGHEARGDRQPTLLVPFLRAFPGNYEAARGGERMPKCFLLLSGTWSHRWSQILAKNRHISERFSLHLGKYSVGAEVGGWTKVLLEHSNLAPAKKGSWYWSSILYLNTHPACAKQAWIRCGWGAKWPNRFP